MAAASRSSRRRRALPPVLLPRPSTETGPLPAAVPILALLGLIVLCFCTLPAVRTQRRLDRDHLRLERETQRAEAEVERLRRELRDGAHQRYLRIRATRALLHRGSSYIEGRDAQLAKPQVARK